MYMLTTDETKKYVNEEGGGGRPPNPNKQYNKMSRDIDAQRYY